MKLVIVESPAKCNTIKKYLGSDYIVEASLGHIRDLATSGKGGLGVDVENGFTPKYVISKSKKKKVDELIKLAASCDEVILATDPDREGEAIAWHLAEVLKLDVKTTKRLEFHEITRDSILAAMANPRTIDMNLVYSQEARRIVDRIIGFKLSNLIYKKIKSRSAGRVQSVTLKLIAEHDKEIKNFVPEEYWVTKIKTSFLDEEYELNVVDENGKVISLKNEEETNALLSRLGEDFEVINVETKMVSKESKPPFTTSTLQQEAFAKLKFTTSKTQKIAQKLYEGINVGDEHVGLITYMRTDSTRLSPTYIARANSYILETFGKDYLGKFKPGKGVQDAHEAIRPTSNHRTPESVKRYLSSDEYNLYKLIYNRALESLMKPKIDQVMTITLKSGDVYLEFELTRTVFLGYEIVESRKGLGKDFPEVPVGMHLPLISKEGIQKFTQPPAFYSEAKVVKLMEEEGIGRPSTYAATIEILLKRKYIERKSGLVEATDQGARTAHVLEKYFPNILNVKYTAAMEKTLDSIQDGSTTLYAVLSDFYGPFIESVEHASEIMYMDEAEPVGRNCPECGAPLVYKESKNGKFIGCSNYPKCKYSENESKEEPVILNELCPECGSHLVERKDKKGKTFIGCSNYPNCRYIKPIEYEIKVVKKCPVCGGDMVRKKGKFGFFLGCTNFPTCTHMERVGRHKGHK